MKVKFKLSKKLIILAVAVLMVATTAVSFAFWSNGVSNADTDSSLSVTVGSGNQIATTLTASQAVDSGILIPGTITPESAGEVQALTFEIDVSWATDVNDGSEKDFTGVPGTLTVTLGDITYVGGAEDGTVYTGGLFNVDLGGTAGAYAIAGDGSVTVTVTVTMSEPDDIAAYNLVAGKSFAFEVLFSVIPG